MSRQHQARCRPFGGGVGRPPSLRSWTRICLVLCFGALGDPYYNNAVGVNLEPLGPTAEDEGVRYRVSSMCGMNVGGVGCPFPLMKNVFAYY